MISVDEHLATILAAVRPLEGVVLPLAEAAGHTLRESAPARIDLPPFDNSAMDGFAVRFADVETATETTPVRLRVIADLPAGGTLDPTVDAGEAARIMTGAPLPTDADTVVPFEATEGGLEDSLDTVLVREAPRRPGAHVRLRAEDTRAGDDLIAIGTALDARRLAALASANIDRVTVSRRPRVAVISTGSELVLPGESLTRGQIPESNALMLAALADEVGAHVVLRTTVADVDDDLRRALARAADLGADAVITSGGVGAGAYEVVKNAAPGMTFSQVALQPGRPQGFAPGEPLVFGLPGNPLSAAVSFEVFVRPALLRMQGRAILQRASLPMIAATGWRSPRGRRHYVPVSIAPSGVEPASGGGSHAAARLAGSDGYAVVGEEIDTVQAGDLVDVVLFA